MEKKIVSVWSPAIHASINGCPAPTEDRQKQAKRKASVYGMTNQLSRPALSHPSSHTTTTPTTCATVLNDSQEVQKKKINGFCSERVCFSFFLFFYPFTSLPSPLSRVFFQGNLNAERVPVSSIDAFGPVLDMLAVTSNYHAAFTVTTRKLDG